MAGSSERPPQHETELEAFVDSDSLTLDESDLTHPTDAALPVVKVSAEDEEFIDRVFSQVRDVDFRVPPPPPPAALDGHEKKIGDLREKVRKLERDLARVGHVWSLKHQQIDALDDILAKADAARTEAVETCRRVKEQAVKVVATYKQQAQASQSLSQTLGARKTELEVNYQRLSEDHAQMSSRLTEQVANLEREQARSIAEYRQKLESAQETFQQLREQSAHHLGMLQAQLQARDEQTARQQDEITRLQQLVDERDATLESVRTASAANYEALRDSSSAALEAQRSSSVAEYEALRDSSSAALEAQRLSSAADYEALRDSSSAALEAQRSSSAAEYASLRDSSSAALEAQRSSSAADYASLRDSSSAALEALKTSSDADYEALKDSSATALETLRASGVAECEALRAASAANHEALRESSSAALESLRVSSSAVQDELKARLADVEKAEAVARSEIVSLEEQVSHRDTNLAQGEQRYQEMDRQHQARYQDMDRQHQQRYQEMDRQHQQRYQEMDGQHQARIAAMETTVLQLRDSSAAALESLEASSTTAEEALKARVVELEKIEAVVLSQLNASEEQVRQRDASLTQNEQRYQEMDRQHQLRINALEAALEQLKENTALDQADLKNQLAEAQKEAGINQARMGALEVQSLQREESVRSVADRLVERERTTAQLIDEVGLMRVEQERRLAEKHEALRVSQDEVARLQDGLAQVQTELEHVRSMYEVARQERDAFQKLIPADAAP